MPDRRPRRNAQQVTAAIRDAVTRKLTESGYGDLTFEGVADAAEMNKSVLYRRFPDRPSLVLDTLLGSGVSDALPDTTEDLRSDLIAWLGTAVDRVSLLGPGVYRGIIGEAQADVLDTADRLIRNVTDLLEEHVLLPAQSRGQLGPAPLSAVTVQAPLRTLRDQALFGALTSHAVADVVDQVALPLYQAASGLTVTP